MKHYLRPFVLHTSFLKKEYVLFVRMRSRADSREFALVYKPAMEIYGFTNSIEKTEIKAPLGCIEIG